MDKKASFFSIFLGIFVVVGAFFVFKYGNVFTLAIAGESGATFTYTQSYLSEPLEIGNITFTGYEPKLSCKGAGTEVRYPKPSADCWIGSGKLGDSKLLLTAGEARQLTENIAVTLRPDFAKVKYIASFDGYAYEEADDWQNKYEFRITGVDLPAKVQLPSQKVALGSNASAIVYIRNDLVGFDDDHAGAWIRFRHGLLERDEPWNEAKFGIKLGGGYYLIKLDTSELGEVKFDVRPFIKIEADDNVTIIAKSYATATYEVVMPEEITTTKASQKQSLFKTIITKIKGWFN